MDNPVPEDPYEPFNRSVFKFNRGLDRMVLKPLARGYDAVMPERAQKHVSQFFSNAALLPTIANDILQADLAQAIADASRFTINTTLGIFGLFDAVKAFHLKIPYHRQTLGLTLAKYGARKTPYVMLPIFGPKTLSETVSWPVSVRVLSPLAYVDSESTFYALWGLDTVNLRSAMLPADRLVDEAFDPYIFVRDAYLQRHQHAVKELIKKNKIIHALGEDDEDFPDDQVDFDAEEERFLDELEKESLQLSYSRQQDHMHPIRRVQAPVQNQKPTQHTSETTTAHLPSTPNHGAIPEQKPETASVQANIPAPTKTEEDHP